MHQKINQPLLWMSDKMRTNTASEMAFGKTTGFSNDFGIRVLMKSDIDKELKYVTIYKKS
jgi:hypothetical protein